MTVNATGLFFPSSFFTLDYMLGLHDLNTFPMVKKKTHSTGVWCFCFDKIIKSKARRPLALWFHVGDPTPRERDAETLCLPCNHCSFIVCCGAGTQIRSQPGFRRAAALPFAFVVREQGVPSDSRAHLWRLSAGRCSPSRFKQPLFEVARVESRERMRVWSLFGSAWKWLHLKFPTASATANSYTCTSAHPTSRQTLTATRRLVVLWNQVQRCRHCGFLNPDT